MPDTWSLLMQLGGAMLILIAYWANAAGRWSREAPAYLWINLTGAVLLGVVALVLRQWGFVILEAFWIGISVHGLMRRPVQPLTPPIKEDTMEHQRARLLELVETLALSRGHFILSSGKESSYYLDGRMVTLSPEGAYLTGKLMFEAMQAYNVQAVGGLTMGADPVATAVAVVSHLEGKPLPAFLVRKETKTHGKQKQVEGPLPAGARVAIVEDTVTTGESALKAIAAVEALGGTVAVVIALVDRLEGARELMASQGYPFTSLFTIRDLGIDAPQ